MHVSVSGVVRELGALQLLDDFVRANPQSPTAIDIYRDCQRKWGYRKLDKVKRPSNKFAQRGDAVHDVLAKWLKDATPLPQTDAGKIALAGVRHLPLPKTGQVEGGGELFSFAGQKAVYQGKKDWRTERILPFAIGGSEVGLVRVYDHKSTTDFKWAKTTDELRADVQANVYAVHEIANYPDAEPVIEENWVFYRSNPKRPGSLRVVLNVIPDGVPMVLPAPDGVKPGYFGMMQYSELWQRFQEIESDAAEMLDHIRNNRKAKDLPYNTETCKKYGGCPYFGDPCKLTFGEIVRGHMAQESKENIADKIRRSLAERKGNGAAAAPATTAAAATAKPAKDEASAEGKKLASEPLSSGTAAEVQESAPAVNPPDFKKLEAGSGLSVVAAMTTSIAQGVVAARIYNESNASYAQDVAKLAAKVAKAIIAETTST